MINVNNLYFSYESKNFTLSDISFSIPENKIVAVIGANGCGKSTLLNLLAGINFTKRGTIQIDNLLINKKTNPISIRQHIGIVFQNPNSQIIFDNVFDDISFSLSNLKMDKSLHKELITNALEKVNLSNYLNRNPYELSLGQKQRLAIANCLAVNPNPLILDKPTTMLDPSHKNEIYKIIKSLQSENKTIIFSTNNLDEILISDIVIILKDGQLYKVTSKEEIINNLQLLNDVDLTPTFKLKLLNYLNKSTDNFSDLSKFIKENI